MAQIIMVVDDSNAIRQSVSFILKENGFETMEACDGRDGLEKLKDQNKLMMENIEALICVPATLLMH